MNHLRGAPWKRRLVLLLVCGLGLDTATAEDPEDPAPPAAPGAEAPHEDPPPEFDERVRSAVKQGVAWLRTKMSGNGSWGRLEGTDEINYNGTRGSYPTPYGATSLALYALMKCGVPDNDPIVKSGLAFLRKSKDDTTTAYEISMELLAVTATADPFKRSSESNAAGERVRLSGENRAWAESLLVTLLAKRGTQGWRYWGKSTEVKGGNQDMSSTQLATLALFSAERCGLRVDPKIWTDAIDFTLAQQQSDGPTRSRAVHPKAPAKKTGSGNDGSTSAPAASGAEAKDKVRGFAYIRSSGTDAADREPSSAMTACGVASLMMARFSLMNRTPKVWAKQDAKMIQAGIYDGLAWLDANWSPYENRSAKQHWHMYHVYCVERAMDLVGSHLLGKHVWYLEMAEQVLGRQLKDGSWSGGAATTYNSETIDTCFALLFLQRATKGGIPFPSVTGGSDTEATDGR